DGDGLNNLYEYYCDTNPGDLDTDNDGILDSEEDPDNDGLINRVEQDIGSDPRKADTDDDGVQDGVEMYDGTSPTNSLQPAVARALRVDGTGYVEL
ncbi:hypothetical protein, partial [Flavihumibacter cheonanensis]|uniref:hypothetical protein n=1 Tax=Flavihumibacter cheonanensis TaxID=1442385 RepID=UPI001EF8F790